MRGAHDSWGGRQTLEASINAGAVTVAAQETRPVRLRTKRTRKSEKRQIAKTKKIDKTANMGEQRKRTKCVG